MRRSPEPVRAARLDRLADEAGRWLWFVVEVAPQREFLVQRLIEARGGAVAFVPTRVAWRRPNGATRRKRAVVLPVLPRFVLVGAGDVAGLWDAIRDMPHVSGVVGCGGQPRPVGLAGLMWMAGLSSEAPAVERFMQSRAEFGVGDVVRMTEGPLDGVEGRVVALDGHRARVLAPLFGGPVAMECEIGALVAVNG